ncbi:MAG: DsbA family protein [Acidobacteriia bacterium]|nr:DsbA family protein [Terriglobia bacterium]
MIQHTYGSLDTQSRPRQARRPRAAHFLMALCALGLALAPAANSQTKQASARHASAKPSELPAPQKGYGSASAPIVMEVFSDYQCPMCRNLFEQTLRPMIADYVAAGKVYLVHRDFPLAGHLYSGQAARWANAAARVGKFEAAEGALYDNQATWEANGNIEKFISEAMSAADFARVQRAMQGCEAPGPTAGATGGVMPSPKPCAIDPFIAEDIMLGLKLPVHATPTYVITYKGQRLPAGSGFVSWPILKQFFDSLLSQ